MIVADSLPLSLITSPHFSPHSGRESLLLLPLLLAAQMPRQFHFLPMSLNVRHLESIFVSSESRRVTWFMNRRLYKRADPVVV